MTGPGEEELAAIRRQYHNDIPSRFSLPGLGADQGFPTFPIGPPSVIDLIFKMHISDGLWTQNRGKTWKLEDQWS